MPVDSATRLAELHQRISAAESYIPERLRPLVETLFQPSLVLETTCTVRSPRGEVYQTEGWRSQHSRRMGTPRGGTRVYDGLTKEEVVGLSLDQTLKNVAVRAGGAKGGIRTSRKRLEQLVAYIDDPAKRAEELLNLEKMLWHSYVKGLFNNIGPGKDVLAPDAHTGPREMAMIVNSYSQLAGRYTPSVAAGKPEDMGGHPGRPGATGLGVFESFLFMLEQFNIDPADATANLFAFGNVNSYLALWLQRVGVKIKAIREVGADGETPILLFNEAGIDATALYRYKYGDLDQKIPGHGTVEGFDGVEYLPPEEFFDIPATGLVPSGLGHDVDAAEAARLKVRFVSEGGNNAVTVAGDEVCYDKGIIVAPDIAVNVGGSAGSCMETETDHGEIIPLDRFENRVRAVVRENLEQGTEAQQSRGTKTLREGFMVVALTPLLTHARMYGASNPI